MLGRGLGKRGRRSVSAAGRRGGTKRLAAPLGVFAILVSVPAVAIGADSGVEANPEPAAPLEVGLPQAPDIAQADVLSNRLAILSTARFDDASPKAQSNAVSLGKSGPGSLQRLGDRLIVQTRVERTSDATIAALEDAGAKILYVSDEYGTVDLAAAEQDLRALAEVEGVVSIVEAITPMTNSFGEGAQTNIAPPCGSIISEGDTQLRAAEARSTYEVDGTGVKVGVVSDSYDVATNAGTRASQDVGSGDLPGAGNTCGRTTPVQVTAEGQPTDIDEGRAMAQIVHDMAPGAALAVASRGASEEAMANNIRALSGGGANIIVDDITFFAEPFYQDGPISVAYNEVLAAGRTTYSSAANSNIRVNGENIGSWEAPSFRLMNIGGAGNPCVTGTGGRDGIGCMDFDPGAGNDFCYDFSAGNGPLNINLQWAEPRNGVGTDLDMYLATTDGINGNVTGVVLASQNANGTTGTPFELLQGNQSGGTYCILINKVSGGADPRLKFIHQRGPITGVQPKSASGSDVVGPSIFGHNGAASTVSTAAVPYDNSGTLEDFSSYGPIVLTHGPVSGTTPAAPLSGGPQTVAKPDLAATDNNRTTFFTPTNDPGIFRFSGTSAAAPHAAGVAALQLQANPNATPDQIKQAQYSTARAIGSLPREGTGAGLLDAVGAVGATLPAAPPPDPDPDPPPVTPLDVGIGAKKKQKIKQLSASVTCNLDCTATVVANVRAKKGKGKKKKTIKGTTRVQGNLLAGITSKAKLKFPKRVIRKVSKLKGKVTLKVGAVDALGQQDTALKKVKLKPTKKKKKK